VCFQLTTRQLERIRASFQISFFSDSRYLPNSIYLDLGCADLFLDHNFVLPELGASSYGFFLNNTRAIPAIFLNIGFFRGSMFRKIDFS